MGVSVGVTDLNEQYAWLIEQATAIRRQGELTVMPEPLIGLLNYFEGLREIIGPDLCPLLDGLGLSSLQGNLSKTPEEEDRA